MNGLPAVVRAAVIGRAKNRCEYCGLSQAGQEAAFHIDHIVPRASGGSTTEQNLALACVSYSLHKAAKQRVLDPETGKAVSLYNPRSENWIEHFRWEEERVVGISVAGRVTVAALKMNRPLILAIRKEEAIRGRHPHVAG